MANTNAPSGFLACDHLGSAYNPPSRMVAFAAGDGAAAYKGDLVKFTGAVDTDGITPVVTVASAGDGKLAGAILGFEPQRAGSWQTYYKPASTRMYAKIPADPQQLYMVQEDSVGGNIPVTTAIGQNCDMINSGGNTVTGNSGMQLDSSTAANTNTLAIRLIGPIYRADNDPTTASSNGNWYVKLNLNAYDTITGT